MEQLFSLTLHHDQDVVTARQRAAHIAALVGFDASEQTRIATATSEIVRNAFRYAGGGTVTFSIDGEKPQRLVIEVRDRGRGIPHLDDVLAGRYRSATGMGIGIMGARRLMDRFAIQSSPAGTAAVLEKFLPPRADLVTPERTRQIVDAIQRRQTGGLIEEVQRQNQELLRALDELQRRQQELVHLNRELEDTNRGVVALYAELDEKADHLRRADELKSRFLSNMTHEFRTPVNSIIGLCNLLIEDAERDGVDPGPELQYIRKAAEQLSELVNDLLDIAKVEAGKTIVRAAPFEVSKLFGALRGMLRPLLLNQAVALVFEDDPALPELVTDEGKVSQILRNLISNALKFTERGEVRVSARVTDDGDVMQFSVADTGIGIAPEDQPRIFEEFTQLEHRLQRGVKGTGLGLPLSRRLAELLGGTLTVASEPGVGSTFSVTVPIQYRSPGFAIEPVEWTPEADKLPLLVVEDDEDVQYVFSKLLKGTEFQMYPARTIEQAELGLAEIRPVGIILDLVMSGREAWEFLIRVKRDEMTADVPVIVVSSLPERDRALAAGADAFIPKPVDRHLLLEALASVQRVEERPIRVLVVDDQEVARFLMRQCLPAPRFEIMESENGADALRRAKEDRPDVILLDLLMPGMSGFEVLERLRGDSTTSAIPVVVATSTDLQPDTVRQLRTQASLVVSKANITAEALGNAVRTVWRPTKETESTDG